MTNKFKTLLKTTAAVAALMAGSQSWGSTQIDDDAASTLDLKAGLTFIDKHTYTPSANAVLTIVKATLPDKASVVVNDASDKGAAGTITLLEIKGSGSLSLQSLGTAAGSIITDLVKSGKGKAQLILGDSYTFSNMPEFVGGSTFSELEFVAASNITLTLPAGIATQNLVINPNGYTVTIGAVATYCPTFIGTGAVVLNAVQVNINLSKIAKFKGTVTTGAAATTINLDR